MTETHSKPSLTPRIPRPRWCIRKCIIGWQSRFIKICSACERQDWSKRCAEMLAVTPYFEDLGTTHKPKNTAKAVATAAYPLGERNALLMRSVKSAFALLLTKVTKPAAERRKESLKSGGNHYKKNTQRYVR